MRNKREAYGVGNKFAEINPSSQTCVDIKLLSKRLDVCVSYDLDEGGTDIRWSQGEVILFSNGSNILKTGARSECFKAGEAIIMRWDENVSREEEGNDPAQRLLPSKWNPKGNHTEGSWHLDVETKNQ